MSPATGKHGARCAHGAGSWAAAAGTATYLSIALLPIALYIIIVGPY